MNVLASIGQTALSRAGFVMRLAAVIYAVFRQAVKPATWSAPVRNVLARQLLFTGVEAWSIVAGLALLVGMVVVLQSQVWLVRLGQREALGGLLVTVVIDELAPLLTNFLIIARSGTAIASEMASIKVNGEIRVLDAQGIDPFNYLVVPRGVGVALSSFCLTILFVAVAMSSGYVLGLLSDEGIGQPLLFFDSVFRSVGPRDIIAFASKTLIPGAATGAICCIEGLNVKGAITEVPQAAARAVVRSIAALFVVSGVISVVSNL